MSTREVFCTHSSVCLPQLINTIGDILGVGGGGEGDVLELAEMESGGGGGGEGEWDDQRKL